MSPCQGVSSFHFVCGYNHFKHTFSSFLSQILNKISSLRPAKTSLKRLRKINVKADTQFRHVSLHIGFLTQKLLLKNGNNWRKHCGFRTLNLLLVLALEDSKDCKAKIAKNMHFSKILRIIRGQNWTYNRNSEGKLLSSPFFS